MNTYDIIFEALCDRVESGELTLEDAEIINDLAYDRYVNETTQDYIRSTFGKNMSKDTRKIDVLRSQYKRGKISKEQMENKINEIQTNSKSRFEPPETGSSGFKPKYNRPKNSKKPEDLSKLHKTDRCSYGDVTDETFEKLNRHFKICRTTDDYNEYKQHRKELCRLLKRPVDSVISMTLQYGKQKQFNASTLTDDKPANLPPGTILYHTTNMPNLTRLRGTFRAKDGTLYPTMRVYFYAGKPGSRLGGFGPSASDKYVYQYTGDVSKAKIDQELKGGAVYIETNTSLPVKQVK